MKSITEITDLINEFNTNDRQKTFAEFISVLLKDKFVEIYLGDSYEEISTEQISTSYPAVFCGKIVGAFKECIILNSFGGNKQKKLGNIIFINERAIRAMSELDGIGTVNELFIKSGAESLEVVKAFVDLERDQMASNVDDILKLANDYYDNCLGLVKEARIKKMPSGKYRVISQKGKNLGESSSRENAVKRLQEVEYFKHKDENNTEEVLDLTDIDDFGYSAIMRKLRQKGSKDQVKSFLQIYKKYFDKAVKEKLQKPEKVALQNTVVKFNKIYKVKFPKKLIKNAAISELGDAIAVGKYLANIVRFTLNRISPEKRGGAIQNLRNKLYMLNEGEISSKKMPASASLGQAITFIKHVLFGHDANYVREVINNLVKAL